MMSKIKILKIAAFLSASLSLSGFSHVAPANYCKTKTDRLITNQHIQLCLPSIFSDFLIESKKDLPSNENQSSKTTQKYRFSLKKRVPEGNTYSDIGLVCLGELDECAKTSGPDGYWRDQETALLHIADPTAAVHSRNIGSWSAHEAFPLCGWSSKNGDFHVAKGQCYAAVLSSPKKTISLRVLLGENKGCTNIEKCWATDLSRLRTMLESMK